MQRLTFINQDNLQQWHILYYFCHKDLFKSSCLPKQLLFFWWWYNENSGEKEKSGLTCKSCGVWNRQEKLSGGDPYLRKSPLVAVIQYLFAIKGTGRNKGLLINH